jgi:hypothetical protein
VQVPNDPERNGVDPHVPERISASVVNIPERKSVVEQIDPRGKAS